MQTSDGHQRMLSTRKRNFIFYSQKSLCFESKLYFKKQSFYTQNLTTFYEIFNKIVDGTKKTKFEILQLTNTVQTDQPIF